MALIDYVTRKQAPQNVRKTYDAVEKQMGAVLGINPSYLVLELRQKRGVYVC